MTGVEEKTHTPPRRRRRIFLRLVVGLAVILALGVLLARWQNERMWRHQLHLQREAGLPTTIEEVSALYPPVPDEENGAGLYIQASYSLDALYENDFYGGFPAIAVESVSRYSEEELDAIPNYLQETEAILAAIHEGASRPGTHYEMDFEDYFYLALGVPDIDNIASPLRAAMAIAAVDGDGARFIREARVAFSIADSLAAIPTIEGYRWSLRFVATALSELERALSLGSLSYAQVLAIEEALQEFLDHVDIERRFGCELTLMLHIDDGEGIRSQMGADAAQGVINTYVSGQLHFDTSLLARFIGSRVYGILNMGHGTLAANAAREREMSKILTMTDAEVNAYSASVQKSSLQDWLYSASWFGGNAAYLRGTHFVAECQHTLALTRLRIERYHMRHGHWPESLEALIPEFADAVPIEPYAQTPLIYRREGEGFRLYAPGPDGVDDGGDPWRDFAMNALDTAEISGESAKP